MPKRKRDECENREYDYLARKLKELERKIKRGRRHHTDSVSSSESDNHSLRKQMECDIITTVDEEGLGPQPGCSYWNDIVESNQYVEDESMTPHPVQIQSTVQAIGGVGMPPPAVSPLVPPPPPPPAPTPLPATATIVTSAPETVEKAGLPTLDPELLEIFGEDPTSIKEFGENIHNDLAIRLNHIATTGLTKESRKELREKYLVPNNCKLIKAPGLNDEIKASLIESQLKRDKGIEFKQTLTSCALASLSKAITLLLGTNDKNQELLKTLMDSARVLADIQHSDSMSRRYFVLSTVKKDIKGQLEKTKIDEMLFGNNLAETLKSARTINKSGAELRSAPAFKANTPQSAIPAARNLNTRALPLNRRPLQTGRAQGFRPSFPTAPRPTTTSTTIPTHQRGYRTSSHRQQPRRKH